MAEGTLETVGASRQRARKTVHSVAVFFATLILLLGLLYVIGARFLHPVDPSPVTLALILLSGLSLILLALNRRLAATAVGILTFATSALTALEYVFSHAHLLQVPPTASLAFLVIAAATILSSLNSELFPSLAAGIASGVLFASGTIALVNRLGQIPSPFEWGAVRLMSAETALVLVISGLAFAAIGFKRYQNAYGGVLPAWFPYTTGISCLFVTVSLWWGIGEVAGTDRTPYPEAVFVVGVVACFLLGIVLYVLRLLDDRAASSSMVNSQLQDMQRRLEYILDGTNVGTWEWNIPHGRIAVNHRWNQMLGLEDGSLAKPVEEWISRIHRTDLNKMNEQLRLHFDGETPLFEAELRVKRHDGEWIWVLDRGKVATWTEEGKPLLMSGTLLDVTRRKRAELTTSSALKEKESLLRELQHRTKNNLNMIAGLLSLQSLQSENEELKIALAAVKSRISAMGLLYGQLQEAEDLGSVDIGEYLRRLVAALNGSLGGDHVDVEVDVDPDVPTVTHSQAVYLGILVNEVVTNSLKYAFPGGRQGRVEVSLSRLSRRRLRLAVKDDGIGFVAEQSHSLGTSMGLELSRMLAEEQLKGTYRCDSSDGVEHVMEFDLDRTEVLLS